MGNDPIGDKSRCRNNIHRRLFRAAVTRGEYRARDSSDARGERSKWLGPDDGDGRFDFDDSACTIITHGTNHSVRTAEIRFTKRPRDAITLAIRRRPIALVSRMNYGYPT